MGFVWTIIDKKLSMSTEFKDKKLSFGGRLRLERKRVGLTQEELAAMTGVHTRTQANYELDRGRSGPGTAYFEALRKTGIDIAYVQTGSRTAQDSDLGRARAAERLLMALGQALQIPLDKVHLAISLAADAKHHELQGQISNLIGSSPLLNSKNKVLVLDRDILVDIIDGLERRLEAMNKSVSPLQKAHAIASMYRDFSEKGEIDVEMLEASARSIPGV